MAPDHLLPLTLYIGQNALINNNKNYLLNWLIMINWVFSFFNSACRKMSDDFD